MDGVLRDIERVYQRDLIRFVRLAHAIVGNRASAEEVVHEAFAGAISSRASFRGTGSLEAWLWRTVVNAARRALRDAPPIPIPLSGDEVELPPSAELESISPLVGSLPERQRLVVFLRYYADLDYRSIASVLGVTVGTVSGSLAAAHTALRTELEATRNG